MGSREKTHGAIYPRLEPNQVLTAHDLNSLVDWIEEQDRRHALRGRVGLAVVALLIGVICAVRRRR